MVKTIPSKEEMRLLVKNIYETGIKLNGSIPVNKMDDATQLAAYLYGYSSWKEYLVSLKNESISQPQEELILKLPKFKPQVYKKEEFNFFHQFETFVKSNEENIKAESVLFPSEWLIGKKRNVVAKIDEPIGLLSENYIVTSSPLMNVSNLLSHKIKWLLKYHQSFVLFGLTERVENKSILNLLENHKVKKIGKNALKIDPIEEALKNDNLNYLLKISFFEEKSFAWIWSMLVKMLREEFNYKWTASKLLESLKIESLIEIKNKYQSSHSLVMKLLTEYLDKQCEIKEHNNQYHISEIGYAKHYHQTYLIKENLEKIADLYEEGYFSHKPDITMKEIVFKKENAFFVECLDDNIKKTYWNLASFSYLNALKEQIKVTKDLDAKQYRTWGIWWAPENILSEENLKELLNYQDMALSAFYVFSPKIHIEIMFKNVRQILFLRQKINEYPANWIKRALIETETWEENIWFESFDKLKKMSEKEAYLWQVKNLFTPSGTEIYELKKINLYQDLPFETEV